MTTNDFKHRQAEFVQAMRASNQPELDFISENDLALYRDLIFATNKNIIKACFPVLFALLGEDAFNHQIRRYLIEHKSSTPIFHKVAAEFLAFLESSATLEQALVQLAHYEWLELVVDIMPVDPIFESISAFNLNACYEINPSLVLHAYQYPVHEISPDRYPVIARDTFIGVYRNRNDAVKFMILDLLSARVIYLLQVDHKRTLSDVAAILKDELRHSDFDLAILDEKLLSLIHHFYDCHIITRYL